MTPELRRAAKRIRVTRGLLDEAMEAGKQAALAAHADDGVSESELARILGVNRMTVRRWFGKL